MIRTQNFTQNESRIKATQKAWEYKKHGKPQSPNCISDFIDGLKHDVKGCSRCHNHTMIPVSVIRTNGFISTTWECTTCGRSVPKDFTYAQVVEMYANPVSKGRGVPA